MLPVSGQYLHTLSGQVSTDRLVGGRQGVTHNCREWEGNTTVSTRTAESGRATLQSLQGLQRVGGQHYSHYKDCREWEGNTTVTTRTAESGRATLQLLQGLQRVGGQHYSHYKDCREWEGNTTVSTRTAHGVFPRTKLKRVKYAHAHVRTYMHTYYGLHTKNAPLATSDKAVA